MVALVEVWAVLAAYRAVTLVARAALNQTLTAGRVLFLVVAVLAAVLPQVPVMGPTVR
jgi:hypothetical protein